MTVLFGGHSPKASAATGINQQLNFQGKVVNGSGNNIADGTYNMEFKIYQDGNSSGVGSTLMWTEDYLVSGSTGMPSTPGVTVSAGTFNVSLGSICALAGSTCGAKTNTGVDFNQDTLWLSFEVGNTSSCTVTSSTTSFHSACGGDGAMTPFIRLTAVPQAMNSNKLNGLDSSSFAQLAAANAYSNTNIITVGSATAFQVKNGSSKEILTVDTTGNQLLLGKSGASGVVGKLVFNDGTDANTAAIQSGATGTSYTLTLPTALPGSTQCIQSTSAGALSFTSCGGGSMTIGTINSQTKSADGAVSTGGSLYMQSADASFPGLITNTTQTLAGDKTLNGGLTIDTTSATALTVQDSGGHNSLVFDTTSNHLKIFEDTTTPTNYLDLYYDNATSSGIVAASAGTTKVGSGSGPINITAGTGAAVTITGNAASSFTTSSGGLTFTGATASSLTTSAGGLTLTGAGASTWSTSSGALTLTGAAASTWSTSSGALTLTSAAATTWSTTTGNLTLQAGSVATGGLVLTANAASSFTTSSGGLTLTGAGASTWSTSSGALTLTSAAAATWSTSSGNLTVDSASGLNLGTGAATTVTLGSTGTATGLNFNVVGGSGTSSTYTVSSGLSTGNGLLVTSTGALASTGRLVKVSDANATTGTVFAVAGGSAMTTGGDAEFNGATYIHTAAETGNLVGLTFTDSSTNTTGATVTAGLSIASTLNTSGAGTKEIDGLNVAAPTLTGCATGACTWQGLEVNTQATGAASTITQNGFNVSAAGIAAGTLNGINISGITGGAGTETGLNIGSGWDTAIKANGDVTIGAQADSTPSRGPSSFTTANTSSTAGNFNGDTSRDGAYSSVEYLGKVYVATKENDASSIYRYDGANVWTKVTDVAGKILSTDTANIDYSQLSIFNGKMYALTYNQLGTGCTTAATCSALYSYDGTTWTLVNATKGTFGSQTLVMGGSDIQVCNNHLYVAMIGTATTNTAMVYRYDGGTTFTALMTTPGKLFAEVTAAIDSYVMSCYGGSLIIGTTTGTSAGARVAKYLGGPDPVSTTNGTGWLQLNNATSGTGGTFGAETTVWDVNSITVFGGEIYIGTAGGGTQANTAAIYRYKPSIDRPATVSAGTDWQRITSTIGRIDSASDATDIDGVPVLRQYNGRLYAGSDTSAAGNLAGVYEYDPSVGPAAGSWTILNSASGAPGADRGKFGSETGIDKVDSLVTWNGALYVGTEDSAGNNGSVYTWSKTLANSYGLKFDSGSSNYGTISFAGDLQTGDTSGHQGSFLVSNPINLNGGAFDYAEDYPTLDSTLKPGEPVAVDPNNPEHIRRAEAGDNILGVVSENPGMTLSSSAPPDSGATWVPIALVGRVPVAVTTNNGADPIKPGDNLALSSTPGVLQKAKTPGQVVGTALAAYDSADVGKVSMYVNPGWSGNFSDLGVQPNQTVSGLNIQDQNKTNVISMDDQGNATFAGTITADKIKANQIEGLEIFTDKISSLQDLLAKQSAAASTSTTPATPTTSPPGLDMSGTVSFNNVQAVNLVALAQIETQGGLVVDKDAQFNGKTIFQLLAQFNGDVSFAKQPTFNSDAGGTAVIHKDAKNVQISFGTPYAQAPIVSANYIFADTKDKDGKVTDPAEDKQQRLLDGGYNFAIVRVDTKGFTIILNKPATEDINLNWLAISVKDATIAESQVSH